MDRSIVQDVCGLAHDNYGPRSPCNTASFYPFRWPTPRREQERLPRKKPPPNPFLPPPIQPRQRSAAGEPVKMVVEEITEGVKNLAVAGDAAASAGEGQKRGGGGGNSNRIQVSNTKKPLFFYVNLAKVRPAPRPSLVLNELRFPHCFLD
jgi:hypothetical protein